MQIYSLTVGGANGIVHKALIL